MPRNQMPTELNATTKIRAYKTSSDSNEQMDKTGLVIEITLEFAEIHKKYLYTTKL